MRGREAEGRFPEGLQRRLRVVTKAAGGQGLAVAQQLAGGWGRTQAVGVELAVTAEGEPLAASS